MTYISLYRKYRPATFESIVGQENVTRILQNQIKSGKISHAYIFSGSRGTGKTSAAKVFARAINCLHPVNGEPCNECEVCKNILEGNTTDVVEMDAASNNSVENIRQIRQEVVYATIDVKYRVYIIDEVHMLTTSAFNALLKTLEEPPANVVFILATTEQHKIPVTILSRCLRFEFNKISENNIKNRLEYVLKEENINYEEKAVGYIAKLADGGMRDGLSILERCISEVDDVLKYENVLNIIGAIDEEIIENITSDILNCNSINVIKLIDGIAEKGKDLRQLNMQVTEVFLNKLVLSNNNEKEKLVKIIDKLSKLDNDLRLTTKPIILLKSNYIELCNLNFNNDSNGERVNDISSEEVRTLKLKISNLEIEIEKIKKKLENNASQSRSVRKEVEEKSTGLDTKNHIGFTEQIKNVNNSETDEKLERFEDEEAFKKLVIEHGKIKVYSSLASANMYMQDENLVIITSNSFAYTVLNTNESLDIIKKIFEEEFGNVTNVIIRLNGMEESNSIPKVEKELESGHTDYTEID